jgi:hypothetical protein
LYGSRRWHGEYEVYRYEVIEKAVGVRNSSRSGLLARFSRGVLGSLSMVPYRVAPAFLSEVSIGRFRDAREN